MIDSIDRPLSFATVPILDPSLSLSLSLSRTCGGVGGRACLVPWSDRASCDKSVVTQRLPSLRHAIIGVPQGLRLLAGACSPAKDPGLGLHHRASAAD